MCDTPKNIEHWEYFYSLPTGRDAQVPTFVQDTNHADYIDLPETEPVSGTTMVPLDSAPEDMNIPHDGYPVADENGHYEYEVDVPLE